MVHDESCPCSKAEVREKDEEHVVSLCKVREKQLAEARAQRLIDYLGEIHSLGIRVHNDVIERCQISVLSELCRAAGVYFDLIPEELRTCVLTPSVLYGRSLGKVYGKEPLQKRIGRCLVDEGQRDIWRQLERSPLQLWCYHGRGDSSLDEAHLLTGPARGVVHEFAGIIARSGQLQRKSGQYLGWPVEFDGARYLAFGFPLSSAGTERFLSEVGHVVSSSARDYWERLELTMIRAAVDPLDRHHRSGSSGQSRPAWWSAAYRPGRRWLLRKIIARLAAEFSQPRCQLTLRAHIATVLVDDLRGVADYLAAVDQIREDVLLQFGEGKPGESPITLEDVLAVFFLSTEGELDNVGGLDEHPVAVLLLDAVHLDTLDIDRLTPIREALYRAREGGESVTSRALDAAWDAYRMEQFWLGTHGVFLSTTRTIELPPFVYEDATSVLPDIRALFDARFFETSLDELAMNPRDRSRLLRVFRKSRWFEEAGLLSSLPDDELGLGRLEGVGEKTLRRLQDGLLETALYWRWKRAGLDWKAFRGRRGATSGSESAIIDIHSGLDELADLFE